MPVKELIRDLDSDVVQFPSRIMLLLNGAIEQLMPWLAIIIPKLHISTYHLVSFLFRYNISILEIYM